MPAAGEAFPTNRDSHRLEVLDGLRGVAALMVVAYHFSARWTHDKHGHSLYAYGDTFYQLFPFSMHLGTVGVSLFFLISGFVIMMTLRNSSGIIEFSIRRIIRLWPTMIVCATLTTILVNTSNIHERFVGVDHWPVSSLEFLSSILFVDPEFTGRLLGIQGLSWVDGVYWTLWVEVRFYALIAVVYLLCGDRHFGSAWLAIQTCSTAILATAIWAPNALTASAGLILQPGYLFWFTFGIAAYYMWLKRISIPILLSTVAATIGAMFSAFNEAGADRFLSVSGYLVLYASVIAIFLMVVLRGYFGFALKSKPAVTIGLASYPLYMFHERVGIISTTTLADLGVHPVATPILVIIGLLAIAILIHRLIETPSQRLLRRRGMRFALGLQRLVPAVGFNRSGVGK